MHEKSCQAMAVVCKSVFEKLTGVSVTGVSIKHDQKPNTRFAFASTINFEDSDDQLAGHFTLGFTDIDLASKIANTIAKKMRSQKNSAFKGSAPDVLNELMRTIMKTTSSRWHDAGLDTTFSTPYSNPNLKLKPNTSMDTENYMITLSMGDHRIVFRVSFSDLRLRALKGSKILVVDDSKLVRHVVSKRLEDYGFDVSLAKNGLQAVEMHTSLKPDLVIMDQLMPEMNGLDAIMEITKRQRDTKFIMLTSTSGHDEVVTAKILGVCKYLIKPLRMRMLFQTISEALA